MIDEMQLVKITLEQLEKVQNHPVKCGGVILRKGVLFKIPNVMHGKSLRYLGTLSLFTNLPGQSVSYAVASFYGKHLFELGDQKRVMTTVLFKIISNRHWEVTAYPNLKGLVVPLEKAELLSQYTYHINTPKLKL